MNTQPRMPASRGLAADAPAGAGTAGDEALAPLPADLRLAVVCVGAQKSSTTWLHHQLCRLDEVNGNAMKEFNYLWEQDLPWFRKAPLPLLTDLRRVLRKAQGPGDLLHAGARLKARRYRGRLRFGPVAAYREAVMNQRGAAPVVLDFSPDYALMTPRGFARLDAAWEGRVHAVLMMRDPVGRIWSMAKHYARDYHGAVSGERAVTFFEQIVNNPGDIGFARSRYDVTIRAMEAVFPPARCSYVFYETMSDPAVLARLGERLGLAELAADASETRVNEASTDATPPEALVARARALLAPTYDFIRERFADAAPSRWRW